MEAKKRKNIRNILVECLENTQSGETVKKEIVEAIIAKAKSGDLRAFEIIAKFIGEYPTEYKTMHTDEEIAKSPFDF